MMKALLVNGSPRGKGCTFTALTELAKTLEAEGIETEIVHVGNKEIRGRNMAFLMKSIQMGKEKLGIPQKEKTIFTSFHH